MKSVETKQPRGSLTRRAILRVAALLGAGVAGSGASSAAHAATHKKNNVVYHLSDTNKVRFVIGNIRNHIKGVGGPENVHIQLVVHGPALKAFHNIQATDAVRNGVLGLQREGVTFNACGNTMKAQKVVLSDLLPNMVGVPQGGVVKIAELQAEGYLYIRP